MLGPIEGREERFGVVAGRGDVTGTGQGLEARDLDLDPTLVIRFHQRQRSPVQLDGNRWRDRRDIERRPHQHADRTCGAIVHPDEPRCAATSVIPAMSGWPRMLVPVRTGGRLPEPCEGIAPRG